MKVLALLAAVSMGLAAYAGPIYTIIDMGTVGSTQTTGTAINQFGQVTGWSVDSQGGLHAFTAGTTSGDITPGWATGAQAYGVNAAGEIAGTTYVNGHARATSWTNGTAQTLGGLGGPDSYGMAINNSGQIAGMATTAQGQGHAVVYSNGQATDVAMPGTYWSSAYGINNSGTVVGYGMTGTGSYRAYSWSGAGGYTLLDTLGGTNSYAFGINDQGQIVGNSFTGSGAAHAALWGTTGVTDLGTLGGNSSYAYGINNSGQVVGYSSLAGDMLQHAFLLSGGVLFDLNDLVANLDGWELVKAYGINDAGQIVGTGVLNGAQHAFRLDGAFPSTVMSPMLRAPMATPEPGTIIMLAIGLGLIVVGRSRAGRRRKKD